MIHLIVNPVSGGSGNRVAVRRLCAALHGRGHKTQIHETRGPGDAARFAENIAPQDDARIVVVGGDGTVREAATALVGSTCPVLIYPMGTENLVAKYLGMQPDAVQVAKTLETGRPQPMDVAVARCGIGAHSATKRFLLVAGMGFDAEVVRRLSSRRKGHISHADYFWPIWSALWCHRPPRFRVETDQGLLFEGRGLVLVGNIPRYALGMRILERALPTDGRLDVCVFSFRWQPQLIRHSINTLLRRHVQSSGVFYRQAHRIRVTADPATDMELDGDLAGFLPAEFTVLPDAVRFLVSPTWLP